MKSNYKILDAGCGGGRDVAEFLRRGYEVDGLDYSGATVRKCREQFPIPKQMRFFRQFWPYE